MPAFHTSNTLGRLSRVSILSIPNYGGNRPFLFDSREGGPDYPFAHLWRRASFWGRLPLLPPPPFSPPLPPILPDRHPSHYPSSFTPPPSGPTVAPRPGVWKMCKRGHLIFAKIAGDSLRCPLPWIAGRRRREQRRRAGQTLPRRRRARDEEGDNARGRTRGDGLGGGSRKLVT